MTAKINKARQLVMGAGLGSLGFAVDAVTAFFLMPFLIHALGERSYGMWALIGTITTQVWLLDLGLSSTAQRYIARALAREDHGEATVIMSTTLALFVGIGSVVMLVTGGVAMATPLLFSDPAEQADFRWALLITALLIAIVFPLNVYRGALRAALRYTEVTLLAIVLTLLRAGGAVGVILAGGGIVGLAVANLMVVVVEAGALWIMKARYLPRLSPSLAAVDRGRLKELFSFSKFTFIIRIGDSSRYRLTNFIVAGFFGLQTVTYYTVAMRLADYFVSFVMRIFTLGGPLFAGYHATNDMENLREKYLIFSRLCAATTAMMAGGAVVFGQPVITLWLGPGFEDSYAVLAILVCGLTWSLIQLPSRDILGAIYKHPFDAYSSLLEGAVSLGLSILLIQHFGLLGVPLGSVLPMIVNKGVVLPHYVCRQVGLSTATYYRAILWPVVVSTVAHIPMFLMVSRMQFTWVTLFAVAIPYYAALAAAMIVLVVPRTERAMILRALGLRKSTPRTG